MKSHIIKTLVISAAMAVASITSADNWVNVNFGPTTASLGGPAGGSGAIWNQQTGTGTSNATTLQDATGVDTTIGWSFTGGSFSSSSWTGGSEKTPITMLQGALWLQDSNIRTLTISGLNPANKYALYIASFDQNNWANTPMSFSTTNTTTTVGAQVTWNTLGTPWTLNDNYVLFEGLEPNSSNAIVIDGVRVEGLYAMWCGFQLKEITGPPSGTLIVIK